MKCLCNGDLITTDSRKAPENTIRRRKKCIECGRRFTTYEYIDRFPNDASMHCSFSQRDINPTMKYIG